MTTHETLAETYALWSAELGYDVNEWMDKDPLNWPEALSKRYKSWYAKEIDK